MLMIDFINNVLLMLLVIQHPGVGLGSSQPPSFYHYHDYDDSVAADCVVSPLTVTDTNSQVFVTAFYSAAESRDAVACSNGSTSSTYVYVVSLTSVERRSDDVRRRLPRIRVNVVSAESSVSAGNSYEGTRWLFGGNVVVILAAPVSVVWNVRLQQPLSQLQFWVLIGSRVVQGSRRIPGVHHFSLATVDTDSVVTWTRRHVGPLTSLSEPQMSRTITLPIGQRGCAALSPQKVQGCVLQSNRAVRRRDVHVIEVTGSPEVTSRRIVRVVVRAETRRRRHVVLLLRLDYHVTSYIQTEGLRGTLDVVAEYAVNTDAVQLSQVRVVAEQLSLVGRGADLLDWSADKYGRPTSYSRIDNFADLIILNVDANYAQMRTTPDTVTQIRSAPTTDLVKRPRDDDVARTHADLVRSRLRSSITRSRSLNCYNDSVVVSLSKHLIQGFGVEQSQLSLLDGSCHPHENRTHYVWTVELDACGTVVQNHDAIVSYENSIVISGLELLDAADVDDNDWVSNGDDEFSGSSETNDGEGSPVTVAFRCYHSLPSAQLSDDVQPAADQYQLTLYTDTGYKHELTSFPASINVKQTLYVKASVTAGPERQVLIDNCSIIAADVTQRQRPLIVRGCAWDKTVRWYERPTAAATAAVDDDGDDGSQRFEFVLERYWTDVTEMSLQCALTVCNKMPASYDHKFHCQLCIQSDVPGSSQRRATDALLMSRGPLYLDSVAVPVTITTDISRSQALQHCAAAVRVVGLDISAVVGIAFAAFTIGILLTGMLWFIHTRTAVQPVRKRCAHNASGQSTMSCSTPLTTHQVQRIV